ncbi:MAG: M48 family peptidase, partial [Bacillus sp. (in: firmicutes)]
MIHNYLGQTISVKIVYKKRASMGITIDAYGNVEVQAPKGTTDEHVLQIIEGKWDWIQQK